MNSKNVSQRRNITSTLASYENNVFKFGDTFWLQLIGTAMGTPCDYAYATIFFAYFKRKNIFLRFKDNLILYVRFIDDILVV